jgi:formate dehydrogenase major subunit
MLIRRNEATMSRGKLSAALGGFSSGALDRRALLRRAGVGAGGLAALGALAPGSIRKAEAGPPPAPGAQVELKKNICTHCSVGCTVIAEVSNGVWIGQEPAWDSPINRGTHCAKGASVRELVSTHGRRVKYPMKLVGGRWTRISWDTAINEIGDKLNAVRASGGPDSVFLLGSAKFSNEGAYLFRKFAAFWGTNNVDHQARICHSTTVAGVANTWGYGAQTNSYNDIRNSKTMIIMGGNPAEAHPVSLQHVLSGKEIQRANMIVVDPRFTRTAAHATEYVRIRPGTDIPVLWGMLWHIFENGWEDKDFIAQRVHGMDQIRAEVKKWNPQEVERVSGVPGAQLKRVAEMFATQKPSTLIWCMGQTQKTVGTANVRASCVALLATGNVGAPGTGANIFRGHCNVQGATDFGLDTTTLPAYYGLVEGAWRHWGRVWDVPYEYLRARFGTTGMDDAGRKRLMELPGITSTRYFDAALMKGAADPTKPGPDEIEQPDRFKAMLVFGHGANTVTRMPEAVKGLEALDLLVVADPHPTTFAVLSNRKENTYLLPVCTQFETSGSRTASNRSVQWGEQVVAPIFESKNDYEVIYRLSEKLGFANEMFKNIKVENKQPLPEDILREINRGAWSTGYTGQSPERLKQHMANQDKFDLVSLRGAAGSEVANEYYGLPWPCWGTPELKHTGTHQLYNTNLHVMEGGGTFRARFGTEYQGATLLAEGSWSKGSEIEGPYPEFTYAVLQRLGWDADLTESERATILRIGGNSPGGVSWATDLSGGIQRVALKRGCIPFGNGKARAVSWNLPDPVPVHREPIYSPRPDLVAQYPTRDNFRALRMPNIGKSVQDRAIANGIAEKFPIVLTSGRLVEYEGGGEETRSNKWLAELQQDMFVEINTADAAARNIRDGQWVLVSGPESGGKAARMKALVTERVGKGVAFMPFHFAGWFLAEDQRSKYPQGTDPIVLGESVNAITTYGYDPVTAMQETKCTLCQIRAA